MYCYYELRPRAHNIGNTNYRITCDTNNFIMFKMFEKAARSRHMNRQCVNKNGHVLHWIDRYVSKGGRDRTSNVKDRTGRYRTCVN